MTTAERELASTPRWLLRTLGQFVGLTLVLGIVFLGFGSLSLYITGSVYPLSTPFLWLVIVGLTLGMLGHEFDEEATSDIHEILETALEMRPLERRLYAASLTIMLLGVVGFQVGVIGGVSAMIAHRWSIPLLGIAVALFYPSVDAWLGRNYAISVGAVGFWIAYGLIKFATILTDVPTEATGKAGKSARAFLG